jgi:[protein-PII] uridylyltransferase
VSTRERRDRSDRSDSVITSLFDSLGNLSKGVSVAAVGGFGRGELSPGSDLDIIILHRNKVDSELLEITNALLYPLWDQGFKVDHSIRTLGQNRDAAENDLRVVMGLLDIRLVAGDADLVAAAQSDGLHLWRNKASYYLPELKESMKVRHERSGELAYLLEPDLKEARGGLRDINSIRAIALSGIEVPSIERVSVAESTILKIRDSLHMLTKNSKDRLYFQEQDKIAEDLDYADADALMAELAKSARSVDYILSSIWHSIEHRGKDRAGRFLKKIRSTQLSPEINIVHQEVVLSIDAPVATDPTLAFKVAAAAAQVGLPLSLDTCLRLGEEAPAISTPWPRVARENFISLIGGGQSMIAVWEAYEQEGIITSWFPEWQVVSSLPQRNVLHRHTVDRHMVETVVHASALTRMVHRPDLLLFAALFHDIGKGGQEDHSTRGAQLIGPIAERVGFDIQDQKTLSILVEHHLLLSATATRRDLDDPVTIASVLALIPDLETLELLHALSIADGEATGKAAWSEWKASLVADLVDRVRSAMVDDTIAPQPELTERQKEIAASGKLTISVQKREHDYLIDLVIPDRSGLLSLVSGVLNLLRLDVRSARTKTLSECAVMQWVVIADPYAPEVTEDILMKQLLLAIDDSRGLAERIQSRIKAYATLPTIPVPAPVVETFTDGATDATIIEIRTHDRPALLFNIGDVITQCNVDIRSAIVTTLGAEAIDTLYLREFGGGALAGQRVEEVANKVKAALLK